MSNQEAELTMGKNTGRVRYLQQGLLEGKIIVILYLQFLCHVVGDNGCKRREQGSKEYTNITNVNCDVEEMHYMVEKC
jgi:hypothetical protein